MAIPRPTGPDPNHQHTPANLDHYRRSLASCLRRSRIFWILQSQLWKPASADSKKCNFGSKPKIKRLCCRVQALRIWSEIRPSCLLDSGLAWGSWRSSTNDHDSRLNLCVHSKRIQSPFYDGDDNETFSRKNSRSPETKVENMCAVQFATLQDVL